MIFTKRRAEATGCQDEQGFFDAAALPGKSVRAVISIVKTNRPRLFSDETMKLSQIKSQQPRWLLGVCSTPSPSRLSDDAPLLPAFVGASALLWTGVGVRCRSWKTHNLRVSLELWGLDSSFTKGCCFPGMEKSAHCRPLCPFSRAFASAGGQVTSNSQTQWQNAEL